MRLGNVIDSASDAAARSGVATPVVDPNTPKNRTAQVGGADPETRQLPPPPAPRGSGRGQVVDILV